MAQRIAVLLQTIDTILGLMRGTGIMLASVYCELVGGARLLPPSFELMDFFVLIILKILCRPCRCLRHGLISNFF